MKRIGQVATSSLRKLIVFLQHNRLFINVLPILIGILLIFSLYGNKVWNLNQHFFCGFGDGLKTYYNVAYNVQHSNHILEHQGMAYPYGEGLFLEDTMPFFNISLHILIEWFPGLANYLVGIINTMFFISLLIGVWFMYLILRRLNISPFIAALAANGIMFLSSQNILLNPAGHIGLTFSCFFPMSWYFLIRFFESKNTLKWSILWAFSVIFWSMFHVYLGLMLIMFGVLMHFFHGLIDFKTYKNIKFSGLAVVIQFILPLIYFVTFFKILDQHPDRIDMPFLETHRSTLSTVFLPNISPIKTFLVNQMGFKHDPLFAWSHVGTYVGLLSIFTSLFCFIELVLSLIKGNLKSTLKKVDKSIYITLLAAVSVLIFSFALPIRLFPEALLNQIPFIKQFISLGRFGWPFYYIIATFSVLYWSIRLSSFRFRFIFLVLFISIMILEALPIHINIAKGALKVPNSFNKENLIGSQTNLVIENPEYYQAILPFQQFYKFNIPFNSSSSDSAIYAAMTASVHSGLPIMSTYLSRPSVTESMKIYKMLLPWPYQKNIPEIVADGRDIAVVVYQPDIIKFNANEKALFAKCKPQMVSDGYSFYTLSIDDLLAYNQPNIDSIIGNHGHKTLWSEASAGFIYYNNFDTLKGREIYMGNGAFEGRKSEWNVAFKIPTSQMDTAVTYTIGFWTYNHIWDQTFNTAVVNETDSLGKTLQWLYFSPLNPETIDGWWYYISYSFKVKSTQSNLALVFKGDSKFENWFAIDEVLIRETDATVYQTRIQNDTVQLFKNGLLYGFKPTNP